MTSTQDNMGRLIDQFCDHLWLGDGLAATTLTNYRQDMLRFGQWCSDNNLDPLLSARSDIERHLATQLPLGRSCLRQPATVVAASLLSLATGTGAITEATL